jgi:branched-subunit amino acid aminotransferase/4-amino-4-deoxychorismate lyase
MEVKPGKYICFNGEFLLHENPVLSVNNRAFRYGDGLFESIHACGTEAQLLDLHLDRLRQSMSRVKMIVPAFLRTENVSRLITKLLNKNRIFVGARVRLTVFRNHGGLYAPEDNNVSFILESIPLDMDHYALNPHGYNVDVFNDMPKPTHPLSWLKSTSALLYVLAGIYKKENRLDDCILVNEKGHLVESGSSNLFLLKNGVIFTPGLEEGCLPGIMRQVLISLLKRGGYKYSEIIPLSVSDLLEADEVFLTNAIAGIRWVMAFQKKRYYKDISQKLLQEINLFVFGK